MKSTHIQAIAFTRKAFVALFPDDNPDAFSFPDHWFDWSICDGTDLSVARPLARLSVVEDTRYTAAVQSWARAANDLGLLPVLVAALDDEPPANDWPRAKPAELEAAIGQFFNDEWISFRDVEAAPLIGLLAVDAADVESISHLKVTLSLPEDDVLVPWSCVRVGEPQQFWQIEAHPFAWRAYARGLARWIKAEQLAVMLNQAGLPQLDRWRDGVALTADDFVGLSKAMHEGLSVHQRESQYFVCRHVPFAGIEVRQGDISVSGPLPVNAAGQWLFAPNLQADLRRLVDAEPRSRIIEMHEVDAVNEPQFEFVVRAGTVESTSSMPPSARRILAQLHWTTAAGTDDRVCLWAVDPTTSAEAGRVELESDTSDSLLNATAIEIGGSVFALSGELPKVVRAGYAILLVQAIARVRASTAKVDEPGGSAWRLHMRSG